MFPCWYWTGLWILKLFAYEHGTFIADIISNMIYAMIFVISVAMFLWSCSPVSIMWQVYRGLTLCNHTFFMTEGTYNYTPWDKIHKISYVFTIFYKSCAVRCLNSDIFCHLENTSACNMRWCQNKASYVCGNSENVFISRVDTVIYTISLLNQSKFINSYRQFVAGFFP